jgi:hypothetical protein
MRSAPTKPAHPVTVETIAAEISRLSRLPLRELKAAWQTEFRREPPKGLWRDLLLRTLAWRIQEEARLMTGGSLGEIAKRERIGERQIRLLIPLAFLPPRQVRNLVKRNDVTTNPTALAKTVQLVWSGPSECTERY